MQTLFQALDTAWAGLGGMRKPQSFFLSVGSMHLDFSEPPFFPQVAWGWYRRLRLWDGEDSCILQTFNPSFEKNPFLSSPSPTQLGNWGAGDETWSKLWLISNSSGDHFFFRGYTDRVASPGCPKPHVSLWSYPSSSSPPSSTLPRRCRGQN